MCCTHGVRCNVIMAVTSVSRSGRLGKAALLPLASAILCTSLSSQTGPGIQVAPGVIIWLSPSDMDVCSPGPERGKPLFCTVSVVVRESPFLLFLGLVVTSCLGLAAATGSQHQGVLCHPTEQPLRSSGTHPLPWDQEKFT